MITCLVESKQMIVTDQQIVDVTWSGNLNYLERSIFNCQCAYVDVLDGFGCQLDRVLFQQENGFWLTATFQATTLRLVHVNTGITFDFRKLLN